MHTSQRNKRLTPLLALALLAMVPGAAPADDSRGVVIDLDNPQRALYPIAIPAPVGGDSAAGQQAAEVLSFDLGVAGWFKVLDPRGFLADLEKEGLGIEPKTWDSVGAFGVIKSRVTASGDNVELEFRLYEIEKGNRAVLTRTYKGSKAELRSLVHRFANEVVKYYTGEDGFFGSKIAFVTKSGKQQKKILAMDFDGANTYSLTRNRSINILPSWSPSGGKVAFTSYMRNNPDLYVVGAGGGRPKRLTKYYGMNTGASWSPDGSKIALTLSKDGNPEIYIIDASDGSIIKRLTSSRAIDTSPAWSPNCREIAFVSDREGGPQIFVMNADGGNQRRVSFNGDYNTTPVWSPRKGKRIVAYTTRDQGNFDIVTLDLDSTTMTRITQGQGNNEEPSFSPNGRAIAFASTRKEGAGVYIANADGTGPQHRVYKGSATSVDWGPMP
jgi:TolB protein